MSHDKNNITFSFDEEQIDIENEYNVADILEKMENVNLDLDFNSDDELKFPLMINYNENYTVKELLHICDYYGISKQCKKCNKETIVEILVDFETEPTNEQIVFKRQNMWFYMNELKNDKFMRKYIILHF
jgi:hypothetical protein